MGELAFCVESTTWIHMLAMIDAKSRNTKLIT